MNYNVKNIMNDELSDEEFKIKVNDKLFNIIKVMEYE